jgi:putative ABC transport system permease protein
VVLWPTLKRNPAIAFGYCVTLVTAFVALLLALKFTAHFHAYDKWIPGSERVFRVKTVLTPPGGEPIRTVSTPRVFGAWIRSMADPDVEAVTGFHRRRVHTMIDGRRVEETLTSVDPQFGAVLPIHPEAANLGPDEVLLSREAAVRAFGRDEVAGQIYQLPNIGPSSYTVAGVFDLPAATHLDLDVIVARDQATLQESRERSDWTSLDDYSYVRLRPGLRPSDFQARLNNSIDSYLGPQVTAGGTFRPRDIWRFEVQPVAEIPFSGDEAGQLKPGIAASSLDIVGVLSAFLALVIFTSFANYAVLLQSLQTRSTALRRIFGETAGHFAWTTLRDYALTTLAALGAALLLALLLGRALEALWGLEPIWSAGGAASWLWPMGIALVLAIGCAAATVLLTPTRQVERLFEQSYSMSRRGVALRTALFGVQLAGSALIICATAAVGSALQEQLSRPAGIALADMRIVRDGGSALYFHSSQDTLRERALAQSGVREAAFTNALPGQPFPEFRTLARPDRPDIAPATLAFLSATPEFLRTVGGEMRAGRFFARERALDRFSAVAQDGNPAPTAAATAPGRAAIVLSESAARQMGFPTPSRAVGGRVALPEGPRELEVIGVVPDWRYEGVIRPPQGFMVLWSEMNSQHMLIAAESSVDDASLKAALDGVVDGISAKYELLAPVWGEQFSDLQRLVKVGLFISLIVFASLILSLLAFAVFLARSNGKLIILSRLFGAGPLRQVVEPLRPVIIVSTVAVGAAVALLVVGAGPLAQVIEATGSGTVRTAAAASGAALLLFAIAVMLIAGLRVAHRQEPIEVLAAS